MRSMSMIAIGTYLKTLRESLDLTRDQVAHLTGTNNVQIFRIEKGEIDTRGSLLMKFANVVNGNANDLLQLLIDEGASAEDGKRRAQEWMDRDSKQFGSLPDSESELEQALEVAIALRRNQRLAQWVEYGKSLIVGGK